MRGIPGDRLAAMITFSNSSSSTIYLQIVRYSNIHPPYWAICYCYDICHSPAEDSLLVEVDPLSSKFAVVQFKTDSVNPGIAYNSFDVYQVGFESAISKIHLTASTELDVGLGERNDDEAVRLFPNPAENLLNITAGDHLAIQKVAVYDGLGALRVATSVSDKNSVLDISELPPGIYSVRVATATSVSTRRLIKY
jgi:hypothetical protein